MDLVDRLREAIRSQIQGELGGDPSGELGNMSLADLLIIYGNWKARHVSQQPRKVHRSTDLVANPRYTEHKPVIDIIAIAIETGADITSHLSRRVRTAYEPSVTRSTKLRERKDLDLLIADWGIHHLHLSTIKEADGFVQRTSDLLFAAFTQDDAYFIDIRPHNSWTELGLLRCVARDWPTAGVLHPIVGLGLAQSINDNERRRLRNAGIAGLVEIDGKVFAPAGQTTAGTPVRVTLHVNQVINTLARTDHTLKDDPQWFDQVLREAGVDALPGDNWQPIVRASLFGFVEQVRQIFYPIGSLTM